jgi:glycosyltransferase involved in cell wall biosynthesis/MoaA/NifB/PqqE/SkfB family radical SAM enzyme
MSGVTRLIQHDHLKRPLVSIIVTCFNYADYIETCLRSVREQTYDAFECVIVDDVSTDSSVEVVERFIRADAGARFHLVRHTQNQGQMAAFQTGLQHAHGRFVVFVDADDMLLPHFLETHVAAHLNGLYEAALTNSDQFQIGADGQMLSATYMGIRKPRGDPHFIAPEEWRWNLDRGAAQFEQPAGHLGYHDPTQVEGLGWMWSTTSAAMVRRDVLDLIMSPECRSLRICADGYVFRFAHALGGTLIIPTVCGSYRRHGTNGFSRNPIIGGFSSTGDVRADPMTEVRALIFRRLVDNFDRFHALLGSGRMAWLLLRFGSGRDFVQLTWSRKTFPSHLFVPNARVRPEAIFCRLTWPPTPRQVVKSTLGWLYLRGLRYAWRLAGELAGRADAPAPDAPVCPVAPPAIAKEPPSRELDTYVMTFGHAGNGAPARPPEQTDAEALPASAEPTEAAQVSRIPAASAARDRLTSYLETSDSFCMMPWVHMHSWPDGRVLPCCLGNPDQPLGHLDSGLKGVWNSDAYKQFRVKLLNGEAAPEHCKRCYEFDRAGHYSLRKTANRKFGKHLGEALEHTRPDGTYAPLKLRHIDFRYSNFCNLKCRSCCHELSSKWHDDSVALYGDKGLPVVIKPRNQGYLDELIAALPFVESVYFAGGEPLIQEEHYFILRKLKEIGRTDVDLTYATNFTTLSTKKWDVLEYWDGFRSVDLMASLDGSGRRGELMRHGQKWETIVANRKTLMKTRPNVKSFTFQVCTTVSAMNIFHIADFQREWINAGLLEPDQQLFNLLTTPEYYSAQILPPAAKARVEEHCREFMASHLSDHPDQRSKYEGVLAFMHQEDSSHYMPQFVEWMKRLDARRQERFVDVFPEWRELFARYGG